MRKQCVFLLLVLMLLATLSTAYAYKIMYVYTRDGDSLNLRDIYTNQVITKIPFGTELYV